MVFRCILIWDFKKFSWPRSQSFLAPPFWPFSRFCRCIISCALFLKISFRPQSEVGLFYQDSELGFDRICFQHYVRASTEALLKALFTLILLDLRSWCDIKINQILPQVNLLSLFRLRGLLITAVTVMDRLYSPNGKGSGKACAIYAIDLYLCPHIAIMLSAHRDLKSKKHFSK